jgi:RNA polymerase sigma-70 factor (ECF subfamily)
VSNAKQTEFMQAYAKCHEPFVRYCSALAYGKMDAQDLVQDVLLSTFHKYESIEKKDQLLHYLVRAARNRAISVWRIQRRSEAICEKQAERLKERGATAEMLVDVKILYTTLDRLPSDQREALVLFEVSGLPMAEIAEIQNCSEGTVKTRVSRARAKVRGLLDGRAQSTTPELLNAFKTLLL